MISVMPKPTIQRSDKSDKVTFRCSSDLKKHIQITAIQQDKSMEDLCIELLAKGLGLALADAA